MKEIRLLIRLDRSGAFDRPDPPDGDLLSSLAEQIGDQTFFLTDQMIPYQVTVAGMEIRP